MRIWMDISNLFLATMKLGSCDALEVVTMRFLRSGHETSCFEGLEFMEYG